MRMCVAVLLMVVLVGSVQAACAAELCVGVAQRDITPPVGYRMSGYFYERLNTGTHDPLHAKALVLVQGEEKAALVFCDLIGISRAVTDAARKQASEQTKIPAANILIAATHSHTGPLYGGTLRDYFHTQAITKHGHDPAEKIIDYPAWLANRIVDAIDSAHRKAASTTIEIQQLQQAGVSFNRRFHMKDGSVRFNPGRKNPDIVRVAGPIDPQLSVLNFRQNENALVASLRVFALHLDTVGGTQYSADFPGYLNLEGSDYISLFGAGTCGDINHIDVSQEKQPTGQAMAEHIGRSLLRTISLAPPGKALSPTLAVKSATVSCPVQKYSAEEIAKATANMSKIGGKELSFLEQVETYKIVALQTLPKEQLACEVQVFRLADNTAIVGLPGEVFVELGLAIKTASPFEDTIVIELCNDAPGYIPTRKAFAEGSYETVNSFVAPGGGEMLVEEAVRLLKQLKTP